VPGVFTHALLEKRKIPKGYTDMPLKDEGRRSLTFMVPVKIAEAVEALAAKEFCTMSQICRRALARDLRAAGLLTEKENA
jgi:hypothetical protein